jgi:hypothetical protein
MRSWVVAWNCIFCLLFLCFQFESISYASKSWFVSDGAKLVRSLDKAETNDVIFLEDGTYSLGSEWAMKVITPGLTVRSRSGVRENVMVKGSGMFGQGQHGFFIDADRVTTQDITIRDVRNHAIQLAPSRSYLTIDNCILRNAGDQILKAAAKESMPPSVGCIVQNSLLEYTTTKGPRFYIGGIDVHKGLEWVVRRNVFRNIRSPEDKLAEHAIHLWSGSTNTLVEWNVIINCDRGIGFGMGVRGHDGGAKIQNNLIHMSSAYPNAIEYRFPATQSITI